MPEWSKGAHLRCAVVHQRVGSNPTGCSFGSPEPLRKLTANFLTIHNKEEMKVQILPGLGRPWSVAQLVERLCLKCFLYSLLTQLVRVLALCAGSRGFESHTGNFRYTL